MPLFGFREKLQSLYDMGSVEKEDGDDDSEDETPGSALEQVRWIAKQREEEGAEDISEEFATILEEVRAGTHSLEKRWELMYLIVPGLFCNTYPIYMTSVVAHFRDLGLDCRMAKVNTGAAVEDNAGAITEQVKDLYGRTGKRVLLVGHSKGGVDAVAALSRNADDLKGKVAGVVCLQSPLGGTPIANDLLGSSFRGLCKRAIEHLLRGDVDALGDLTYEKRKRELEEFPFPYDDFPVLTFSTGTSRMCSTMAPLSRFFRRKYDNLVTDGMVAADDADLPRSLRAFFGEDFDHGGCAFPDPGDTACAEDVNEAAITLLLRRVEPAYPS